MKYAVVYSSVSGNTHKLAEAVKDIVGDCYFGKVDDAALDADVIFVGFWTMKNTCGADVQKFFEKLSGKKIFIFGTAGYDYTDEYFAEILGNVKAYVPASNQIVGSYMCQGRVTDAKQENMKETVPEKYEAVKDNLVRSVNHPSASEIDELKAVVEKLIN